MLASTKTTPFTCLKAGSSPVLHARRPAGISPASQLRSCQPGASRLHLSTASAPLRGSSLAATSGVTAAGVEVKSPDAGYSDQTKCIAEFLAQALFNFLSCAAVAAAGQMAVSSLSTTFLAMGAHLVIVPMLIFIFGGVSGGHFNPIITAAMVAAGQLPSKLGISYILAQCAGAVVGSFAHFYTLPSELQTASMAGLFQIPANRTVAQALTGEFVAAFFFIITIFACLTDKRGWGKLAPLSVGISLVLLMWLVGPISSNCINPARLFGSAIVSGVWDYHWVFWVGPMLGALSAGATYAKLFLPADQSPQPMK